MNWSQRRSMGPLEYRKHLAELGWSQSAAGRFLGVSARTSRRYAHGEADIPAAQVLLLRACLANRSRVVLFVPKWEPEQN